MIKSHFKNIESELINVLSSATSDIKVAVCWFTNSKLFNILCEKQRNGVAVSLIVLNDDINNRQNGLNFQKIIDAGGTFYFSHVNAPVHNKYCIVDNKVLVTGSYNWTFFAENKNFENISVIEDKETIENYLDNFDYLANEKCLLVTDVDSVANTTGRINIVEDVRTATEYDNPVIFYLKESLGEQTKGDKHTIVLEKNTILPTNFQHTFRTSENYQATCTFTIRFGDNVQSSQNKDIGNFTVYNLPKLPEGEVHLDTTFEVDTEGILTVKVLVRETNKVTENTFNIKHLVGYRKT